MPTNLSGISKRLIGEVIRQNCKRVHNYFLPGYSYFLGPIITYCREIVTFWGRYLLFAGRYLPIEDDTYFLRGDNYFLEEDNYFSWAITTFYREITSRLAVIKLFALEIIIFYNK